MTPEDIVRRRAAKRFNERIKLFASFTNNAGIASLVGGFLLPLFNGGGLSGRQTLLVFGFAAASHILGQLSLTLLRSED